MAPRCWSRLILLQNRTLDLPEITGYVFGMQEDSESLVTSRNPRGGITKAMNKQTMMAARKGVPSAFEVLRRACETEEGKNGEPGDFKYDVPWSARLNAAAAILDRALGRPKQEIAGTITMEAGDAFVEAAKNLAAAARSARMTNGEVIDLEPNEAEAPAALPMTTESAEASKLAYAEKGKANGD